MTYVSSNSTHRNARTFIVTLLAYAMLTIQLAPMAVAANSLAARRVPAKASETARTSSSGPRISKFAPVPAPVPAPTVPTGGPPNIVATKTDNRTPAQPAAPGDTINYTVTISNTGSTAATGVTFTDTIDANTTLVGGSIISTPLANPDTYNVIGNVQIQPNAAQGLLANDFNPDAGNATGITASGPTTTAQNGNLTINADGSFSYNPAPGFAGTDTFTYTLTVTATGKTDTATVTLLVGNGTSTPGTNVIWFVNPAAAVGGDGRLTNPFNCYTGPGASCFSTTAADDPGDTIFLFSGAHIGGNTLANNQKLIGQGASDTLANIAGLTVPIGSDALPATGGASPTITTVIAATVGVPLGQGNTLRGFTVGTVTGTKISGNTFGTLTVGNNITPDVILNGNGRALGLTTGTFAATSGFVSVATTSSTAQGIQLTGVAGTVSFGSTSVSGATTQGILVGTTTADINFGNTIVSGGTDGVSFQNNANAGHVLTFGTLGVSGGSGNAFIHGAGGGNVTIAGAATLSSAGDAISVSAPGATNVINFQAATSATRTAAGGNGINWAGTVGATMTFSALTIQTNAGTGLNATLGGTITVTNGTGTINNTVQAAPAIVANGITLNANFSAINSSGGTNGVSLTNVTGTSNFGGGSLTGAAGATFLVSAGSPTVTYTGTITQNNAARVVDIQSTTAGTIALNGTITGGASSTGVILNAVNGNVTFTTLNLGTSGARMTNQAVTITNGTGTYGLGTANIFTSGAQGISATNADGTINCTATTVDATNARALLIDGPAGITTLGMTLIKVASTNSTTTGMTLQDVGGSFSVIGDNANTAQGGNGSGGVISGVTGADGATADDGASNGVGIGIYLFNATGVQLRRMTVTTTSNFGLEVENSPSLTVQYCKFNGTQGDNTGQGEGAVRFLQMTGTVTLDNCEMTGSKANNIRLDNNSGTLTDFIVSNNNIHDNDNLVGNDGIGIDLEGTATIDTHITGNTLSNHLGDHIDVTTTDTANADVVIKSNTTSGTRPAAPASPGDLGRGIRIFSSAFNSPALIRYDISNNTMTGTVQGGAIHVTAGGPGTGTYTGQITNNTIGTAGVNGSGSLQSDGIIVEQNGSGVHNVAIAGNNIRQYFQVGINVNVTTPGTNGTMDATITGNTVTEHATTASTQPGVFLNSGNTSGPPPSANQVCYNLNGNTIGGAGTNSGLGSEDFRVRQRFSTTVRLPGYAGAATDTAAVVAFLQAQNTGAETGSATTQAPGGGFVGGAPCNAPNVPTIATPSDEGTLQSDVNALSSNSSSNSITSQPFVSSPRQETVTSGAVALVVAPPVQSLIKPAVADTVATKPADKGDKGITPLVANFPITIGTLEPGKSVTITFSVTVNNPLPGGVTQVSNQGTVSGSNFASLLTDDPDTGAANDPTITGIAGQPDIFARDARAPEPPAGTANMLFTVTLSLPAPGPVSVNYATADGGGNPATGGTCAGGADYETTSGTVNFVAGQQVRTVPVVICSDATVETDETLLLNLSGAVGGNIVDAQAVGTITLNTPGDALISEVRTSGPAGAGDDFVELYNNSDSQVTVAAADASPGVGLFKMGADCNATPVLIGTIPNGTVIPARSHYLFVGSSYSLGAYATGDATLTADIENDSNLGFFATTDPSNLSSDTRLDAVGFGANTGGGVCDLLREGNTLPPVAGSTTQYSFFRKLLTGLPQDTNDNASDFQFADTFGTFIAGVTQRLGAPGPENAASPIQRNATIKAFVIDPLQPAANPPNRVRDFTSDPANNSTFGTLDIRRKFTNNTGGAVTRLRFRVVDITTFPTPPGTADLRPRTSTTIPVTITGGTIITVQGTTLEQPPAQPNGGGVNSSLSAGTITLGTPLAPGASINVRFLLGVQQAGAFRFFINVEALP